MAIAAAPPIPRGPTQFSRVSSHRSRWLVIGLLLGLIALVGIPIWRMHSLDGLPDVGDPFDVIEARRPIDLPDADNALAAYAVAGHILETPSNPIDLHRWNVVYRAALDGDIKVLTWSSSSSDIRVFLKAKRQALDTWREGSHRRDGLYYQPNQILLQLDHESAWGCEGPRRNGGFGGLSTRGGRRSGRRLGLVSLNTAL